MSTNSNISFQLDPNRSLFEQSSDLPYDMDFEFPRERLRLVNVLGSGAFGEVWLAQAFQIKSLDPRNKSDEAEKEGTEDNHHDDAASVTADKGDEDDEMFSPPIDEEAQAYQPDPRKSLVHEALLAVQVGKPNTDSQARAGHKITQEMEI